MNLPNQEKRKHIGKFVLAYAGVSWIIIQVVALIISQYDWPIAFLDITILLFIFGLPATIVYAINGNVLNNRLKLIYGVNVFLAISVIAYYFIKPDSLQPNQIKFLKFKDSQKEIAQNIESIAVLPFSNFTGDSDKEYLSYAIHDALISEIGSLSSLRVKSKTSTLALKEQNKSLEEIADELNVDAVIEGSIVTAGNNLKVNVSLVSVFPEEFQLWTKDYEVTMAQLLNVYSSITKNLAEEIDLPLTKLELNNLEQEFVVNPAAYEAYLKGKYHMGLLTKEDIIAAQKYFEQAIEIDSNFAPAYAALGGVWGFLKQMNFVTTDQAAPFFGPNIEKAKTLNPNLADVYYWEAIKLIWTDYNWDEGEKAFLKALELNPNSSESRGLYANFLLGQNRIVEAREQMDIALSLDPKNPFIQVLNSVNLFTERNYSDCIELASKLQQMIPDNPLINLSLFMSYSQIKDDDNFINQAKIWLELEGHNEEAVILIEEYKNSNLKNALLKTCSALEQKDPSSLMAQTMFNFYAIAGETDKTMDWVEKSYIRRDPDVPFLNMVPTLDPYRNNPRLIEVIQRLKFQNPN